MKRQQVASPEHTPASLPRKACEKNGRREESVGNGKRAGDSLKLGDRRVLVKMPGNRLKVATSSQQGKEQEACDNKVPEVNEIRVKDEEGAVEEGQKRPLSDGVNLLQWGQKKRLRFNNKGEAKAVAEESSGVKNAVLRPDKRVVRAEKVSAAPAAPTKGQAAAPCSPSPLKSATGDSRRDAEGTAATATGRNGNHSGLESEANTARRGDTCSQQPLVNPDKGCASPVKTSGALSARGEENVQPERAGLLEKVDMELFQWPKFLISLSRKEKEDDFFAIKGSKLPIRPKKRLKHVEKALHYISPGTWLCELTRERYEVREKKAIKKKPRGLKAMGSADSDTE